MAGIRLQLFGPPTLTLPGGETPVRAAKCLALLAFLALERGAHTRQELAALLWGDSDERSARASLRQALMRLRRALGQALRADRRAVELVGELECDAVAFLRTAEADPLAASSYDVHRFLAGFTLHHAPAFDEWVDAKRHNLLQRYEQALRTTARKAMAESRWLDAVAAADRWLACDPLSDDATRIALQALYLSGDRGAALHRYREYCEQVAQELNAEPSPSLQELAERIEANVRTADLRSAERAPGELQPSFDASLRGREQEWTALLGGWDAVAAGHGRVILIEGEAGVGKTRLADEFLRWVALEGATTLRGRGYDPRASVPWGPVVEWLRAALEAPGLAGTPSEWLAEAARLVPELRERFHGVREAAGPSDAGDRWRLLEGVVQVILALAAERPVVLFVDDMQWCDSETCGIVRLLARRIDDAPVGLIGTVALGEVERESAAARLCRALRSEPTATVLTVRPLEEEDVWLLIHELGRIRAPHGARRFAARIHDVTGGNPFYVIELLKTLFDQGLLTVDAETGEWIATPAMAAAADYERVPMPPTVSDAIGERTARLAYELRDLLATIAVAGPGIRTETLSHVHGISRLRAAALADALVESRLVVESEGVFRPAHPVIGEVIRSSLTPARRREVHRAIALALAGLELPDPDGAVAGEIARHAERGAELALAYEHALRASEAAARRYALNDALAWLDLAAWVAPDDAAADEINRRAAELLPRAEWLDLAPRRQRPGTPPRGIARQDLDLRTANTPESADGA